MPSEKRRWIWVKAGTGQPEARREVRIRVRRRTHIVVQDLDVHGEGGHVGGEIRKAKWTEVILVEYELRRGKSERERESRQTEPLVVWPGDVARSFNVSDGRS